MPSLSVVEEQFVRCYIDRMSSITEDYIRRRVLPERLGSVDKDSEEFYLAIREMARDADCVNENNAFDVGYRRRLLLLDRYAELSNPICVYDEYLCAYASCPLRYNCLSLSCRMANNLGCSSTLQVTKGIMQSSEATCPTDEGICSFENVNLEACLEGRNVCGYCRERELGESGEDEACIALPEVMSQQECSATVACELPDGTVTTASSEEECRSSHGECSVPCEGFSCKSNNGITGVCYIASAETQSECLSAGEVATFTAVWENDEICALSNVSSEADCNQVCLQYMTL